MKKLTSIAVIVAILSSLLIFFGGGTIAAASGYAAVGFVQGKTAIVMLEDGTRAEVPFTGTAPVPGNVYTYTNTNGTYAFKEVNFDMDRELEGSCMSLETYPLRFYDNGPGVADTAFQYPGYDLTSDFDKSVVVFARYSATDWRFIAHKDATDVIHKSDWYENTGYYIATKANPAGGNRLVTMILIGNFKKEKIVSATAQSTSFFDPNKNGWATGNVSLAGPLSPTTPSPSPSPTTPSPSPEPSNLVNPSEQAMFIDGEAISFDAYLINNQNYVKLRDFAFTISETDKKFAASYDTTSTPGKITAYLTRGEDYEPSGQEMLPGDGKSKPANPSDNMIFIIDGENADVVAYMIGDNNYFRVRDLLEIFDICATFDNGVITLDTTKPFSESKI